MIRVRTAQLVPIWAQIPGPPIIPAVGTLWCSGMRNRKAWNTTVTPIARLLCRFRDNHVASLEYHHGSTCPSELGGTTEANHLSALQVHAAYTPSSMGPDTHLVQMMIDGIHQRKDATWSYRISRGIRRAAPGETLSKRSTAAAASKSGKGVATRGENGRIRKRRKL